MNIDSKCFVGNIFDIYKSLSPCQAVVCSPPYYGVRWYPIEDIIIGGDPHCAHDFSVMEEPPRHRSLNDGRQKGSNYDARPSRTCKKCGAWRGQLGQEPNPWMYVKHLADIFTLLPLNADGVLWVNIKDTHIAGKGKSGHASQEKGEKRRREGATIAPVASNIGGKGVLLPTDNAAEMRKYNLKPKDLALVPARLAMEMQARGWWYRSEIIWEKPSALPESVMDRLPNSTERILQFTKSKHYKFNRNAVLVDCKGDSIARNSRARSNSHKWLVNPAMGNQGLTKPRQSKHAHITGNSFHKARIEGKPEWVGTGKRSLRDVWRMNTASAEGSGDHVAPMPLELARRCILLCTDEGDRVLDPFGGSGTTAVAAMQLNRDWEVVDIDEKVKDRLREKMRAHSAAPSML